MATVIPTEQEIREQAEALYNPAYEADLNALAASAANLTTNYNLNTQTLQNTLVKTLADTQRNIENSMLKRGMGRSTRAAYEVTEGLSDVNEQANQSVAQLLQEYNTNQANIDTQRSTLTSNYQQNVTSKVLDLMQYYESVRQFEEQMALQERELALAYRGSGGGGSSSASGIVDLSGSGSSSSSSGSSSLKDNVSALNSYMNSKWGTGASKSSSKKSFVPRSKKYGRWGKATRSLGR